MIQKINKTEERNLKSIKFKCPYCGHTNSLPSYVDSKICGWCNKRIKNTSQAYFRRTLFNLLKEE